MGILEKLKEFIVESRRVLRITKKPSGEEFRLIVKVSGLGIILIGVVGFLVQMAKQLAFK